MVRELTPLEEAAGHYSDFHKETYGFRPRNTGGWTLEDYEREIERLRPIYAAVCEQEAADEAAAAVRVEETIAKLIGMGAADRDAAIRWLADAEGTGGDLDYLCYTLGLKYGYFSKRFMAAA